MSMHLEGPWLSTVGKRKGKQKFRNAEQAAKQRQLANDWQLLLDKYKPSKKVTVTKNKTYTPPPRNYRGSDQPRIPSVDTGAPHTTGRISKQYTGTKVLGIATMHKSNAVPVFAEEQAIEISQMRRG